MSKQDWLSDDWLALQRKYWDSWTQMSRAAMGQEQQSPAASWEGALDHWWKALAPAAPDAARDFVDKMIDQGKAFFRMGEMFTQGLGKDDPWGAFQKTLEEMQQGFLGASGDGGDALHRMMAFWELPYDTWQRMMSSLSPVPGDFLRNMPHDHVQGNLDRVLSAPGLGYTREEQAQYQDLMRRSMDYQKALQEYLGFYGQLGVKSVQRMQSYMQGVIDSGKSIDSARAIYDNWVMCCETVYAEEVSTPEYARIHGHLVNAQMALKHRMSVMVDESLGALNMPTRSELRTLQDRLQETRRENKQLRVELAQIRRQVAALTSEPAGAAKLALQTPAPRAAAKPAAKKTVARKKTAAKPAVKATSSE